MSLKKERENMNQNTRNRRWRINRHLFPKIMYSRSNKHYFLKYNYIKVIIEKYFQWYFLHTIYRLTYVITLMIHASFVSPAHRLAAAVTNKVADSGLLKDNRMMIVILQMYDRRSSKHVHSIRDRSSIFAADDKLTLVLKHIMRC